MIAASSQTITQRVRILAGLLICLGLTSASGCITFAKNAVPASRLPTQFVAPTKSQLSPINFSMLAAPKVGPHRLGAGDILAVTVQECRQRPTGEAQS